DPSLLVARAPATLPEPPQPSPLASLRPRNAAANADAPADLRSEPGPGAAPRTAAADPVDDGADREPVLTSARSAGGAAPALGLGRVSAGQGAAADERAGDEAAPLSLVVPGLEVITVLPVGEGTTFAG